jgi:hypothetical protein
MATAERITLDRVLDIENFVMLRLKYLGRMRDAQLQRRQEATHAANRAGATNTAATNTAATDTPATDIAAGVAATDTAAAGVAAKKKRTKAKDDPNKAWTTEVLDPITWRNLRITLAVFFGYAKQILRSEAGVSWVPFLHGNTSYIEGGFSIQRSNGHTTAQTYVTGISSQDARLASIAARNSRQYEHGDTVVDNNELHSLNEVKATDKIREQLLQKWHGYLDCRVEEIVLATKGSYDGTVDPFYTNVGIRGRPLLTDQLTAHMRQQYGAHPCHLQAISVSSHFKATEQLFCSSPWLRSWISSLVNLASAEDLYRFEAVCHRIHILVFRKLIRRLVCRPPESGANSARSAEMNIYGLSISRLFAFTVDFLPVSLKGNRIGTLFLLDSVVSLQEAWIKQFLLSRLRPPPPTTDAAKQNRKFLLFRKCSDM